MLLYSAIFYWLIPSAKLASIGRVVAGNCLFEMIVEKGNPLHEAMLKKLGELIVKEIIFPESFPLSNVPFLTSFLGACLSHHCEASSRTKTFNSNQPLQQQRARSKKWYKRHLQFFNSIF